MAGAAVEESKGLYNASRARSMEDYINSLLKYYSFKDAIFLAEMMHETINTDSSLYTYTDCLFRANRKEEVYLILNTRTHMPANLRFLFAKCCFDLNKMEECHEALIDKKTGTLYADLVEDDELSPHAHLLHAYLLSDQGHPEDALQQVTSALETNILMWSAICAYIRYGGNQIDSLFDKHSDKKDTSKKNKKTEEPIAPRKSSRISEMARKQKQEGKAMSDTENVNLAKKGSRATSATKSYALRTAARAAEVKKNLRKKDSKLPLSSRNSNLVRTSSSNSISSTNDEKLELNEEIPQEINEPANLFEIYEKLAKIECAIGLYNWEETEKIFARLDGSTVLNCSTARHQLGRICFEQGEYRECREILQTLFDKKPWRVEGTELLSTSLWHLQDTHNLSHLAQVLTSDLRERAESWCVAGNCFSLQRQHIQAIECMERALQIDSRFEYAYTLLGHELLVQDELDRAAGAFRTAGLLSPRDYRAWYGLGLVHLKKEQNHLAQTNVQHAININPTNRSMLCTLSQIEQQRGRTDRALALIDKALELDPTDIACQYNRARFLFEAKRNEECMEELQKLKNSSPDEAFVFHLFARLHRRIGNTHLALLNYSWAAELDPRGEQNIGETSTGPHTREEYEDDEYSSP